MQGGFGPRFALEAGFPIAAAIGAGFAELSATAIIAVMAVAWLLVCFSSWPSGRRGRASRTVRERPATAESSAEPDEVTDPEPVAAAVEQRRQAEGG